MRMKSRPVLLPSVTEKVTIPGHGSCFVTITFNPNAKTRKIFEVFATVGKAGGCETAQVRALTLAITIGLRGGVPVEEYIRRLRHMACSCAVAGYPSSVPDAIASILEKYANGIPVGVLPLSGHTRPKHWSISHSSMTHSELGGLKELTVKFEGVTDVLLDTEEGMMSREEQDKFMDTYYEQWDEERRRGER